MLTSSEIIEYIDKRMNELEEEWSEIRERCRFTDDDTGADAKLLRISELSHIKSVIKES